ncbi:MAG: cyclic nucleotide-binding domain-containing protein [Ectothiorhodospiraceae bacterium]|nr:cyclic nucleotide-binding domain-containing protein [Ectothiorhodospiraceae bacterium]
MENAENMKTLALMGDGESYRDTLCSMIESVPMFSDLSRPEVQLLAGYVRAYEAKKDAVIFKEGDKGMFMCIVSTGRVNILKEGQDREQKRVATVRPGKSLGEMSLLDELPYSATAVAQEDAELLLLTRMNFERLSSEQPELCNALMRQIARLMSLRLRQTTGVLLDYLSGDK